MLTIYPTCNGGMRMFIEQRLLWKKGVIAAKLLTGVFTIVVIGGCAVTPDTVDLSGQCEFNGSISPDVGISADAECEATVTATWQLNNGGADATDIAVLSIDTGSGTVQLTSSSGSGTITVKSADGSLDATSFSWEADGAKIVAADVNAMATWVSQFNGAISEIAIDVQGIYVDGSDGVNTFAAELEYADTVVSGDSTSWYTSPSNCEGLLPSHQICD